MPRSGVSIPGIQNKTRVRLKFARALPMQALGKVSSELFRQPGSRRPRCALIAIGWIWVGSQVHLKSFVTPSAFNDAIPMDAVVVACGQR